MIADVREKVAETNRPIFTAQETAASSFATTATVDTGRANSAATRHSALLSRPHYVQRTGHDQRARLVQQLQGGYGNQHVARVVARMKQGEESATRAAKATPAEASPPEQSVQQQPFAAAAGRGEGKVQREKAAGGTAPTSPEADGAFQEVVSQSQAVAKQQQKHQPPKEKSQEAQAAAEPPSNEVESKAEDKQVDEMEKAPAPPFDAKAFKAALQERIAAITPKSEKEADEFKDSNKLESVKNDVTGKVDEARTNSQGPLEEKTKATPDTSGITPKPVTPLPPNDPGQTPSDIGAQKAAPKSKGQSEVEAPAQARSQQLDQQLAEADITEAQLAQSNEPQFQAALDGKKAAQTHSETAPNAYRQGEQTQLSQAESTAAATAQKQLQGMHGERRQALEQVTGKQVEGKGKDEQSRAKIAGDIDKIYQTTKTKVDDRLKNLTAEVVTAFDTGAAAAKQTFENYVAQKMEAYKQERYGNWDPSKWLNRIGDWLFGMPPEVNKFYEEGRVRYLADMDRVIDDVATIVGTGLTEAKKEVADGRKQVKDYVAKLPEDLRAIGEEAATNIQSQFDGLEQDIQNKQDELINTLAQKYKENLDALDARIKEMQEENKGLIQKAVDAIVGVIKTIIELAKMLLEVLARVASVIGSILKDPIGFLGTLFNALKQGFLTFVKNIGKYLTQGLLSWLTGALAGANIQMPTSLDHPGIFSLVMQVLGVGYDAMRAKAVKRLGKNGEEKVGYLEKSFEMFRTLATQGVAGVWQVIKERLGDLKTMVLDPIMNFLIENVIVAGVQWIIGLMSPASAFIKACKAIYDIVKFFIDHAQQIADLITSILDAVVLVARGVIDQAAQAIEASLAKAIPVAIGFLASILGLSGISARVQAIIQRMRQPIDKAIDWVIDQGVKFAKKIGAKSKDKDNKKDKDRPPSANKQHDAKVKEGLAAIDKEETRYLKGRKIAREDAEKVAAKVKGQYSVFKVLTVIDGGTTWDYDYVASPGKRKRGEEKEEQTNWQITLSEAKPTHQGTYAVAKLNGTYLAKYFSKEGEHAEHSIIKHIEELVNKKSKLILSNEINKLSIKLSKSPCTSTSRNELPKTMETGEGCTEKLEELKRVGYGGHKFDIRLKIANLYQPTKMGKGAKNASIAAVKFLVNQGIKIIGWNKVRSLEVAQKSSSRLEEPMEMDDLANKLNKGEIIFKDNEKDRFTTQWQSVSQAANDRDIDQWRQLNDY